MIELSLRPLLLGRGLAVPMLLTFSLLELPELLPSLFFLLARELACLEDLVGILDLVYLIGVVVVCSSLWADDRDTDCCLVVWLSYGVLSERWEEADDEVEDDWDLMTD